MEDKYYMWYCPICAKNKQDLDAKYHVNGYIDESIFIIKNGKCLQGHDIVKLSMPCEDYRILTHISTDPDFMSSMVKLHDEDIIEYNLKMSQFKANLGKQESSKIQTDTRPKCPTCGSTNLRKVSATSKVTSVALWGLFSQKVKKTWHCNNCGYEW